MDLKSFFFVFFLLNIEGHGDRTKSTRAKEKAKSEMKGVCKEEHVGGTWEEGKE